MIKKVVIGIVVFFVVVGVIGALTGDSKKETTVPTTSTSSNQQAQPTQSTESMAKIGEAMQDGNLAFTVNNVDTASSLGNQYTQRDAQGMFYIISLKIENRGKETKTIDSSMISLTDSQERKFERSIEGMTAKGLASGKVDLFLQQVQPSLFVNGDIVFDIPKDATGLTLIVKGSVFSSGKKIDLGK